MFYNIKNILEHYKCFKTLEWYFFLTLIKGNLFKKIFLKLFFCYGVFVVAADVIHKWSLIIYLGECFKPYGEHW
jgi:hypothetical protein